MKKSTKILIIAGVAIDVAVTVFLFVISLIMLVALGKYGNAQTAIANTQQGTLKYFLLTNTNVYFWAFVFPLFILLAGNIVGLVFYVKKTSVKEAPAKLSDLSEEQKEALRQELLRDLQGGNKPEEPKEEAPAEEVKEEKKEE